MKVLLVEDSLASSQVTQKYVESAGDSVITARDGNEGIQKFLTHNPDLVLMDVNMPNMDGYQCAQHIRENCQQGNLWIPIIFLSADITEDAIVKGIDAGGDDYLPKPITQRVLSAKLRAMARIADMRKELEAASADLRRLSSIDGLTQLYNRRHFDETLELEWSRSSRTKEPLSLILCDIDHFKAFNDNYGHVAGDDALVRTGKTIMNTLQRPSDLPARYGGGRICRYFTQHSSSRCHGGCRAITHRYGYHRYTSRLFRRRPHRDYEYWRLNLLSTAF